MRKSLSFWTELLKGAPELLNIQTDFPRPAKLSYRGDVYTSTALPELTDRLKKVSKKEQATLFMTLLGSFQTLLYRYTRQEDFVVGVPFANRNQTETEKMIGFFVNTLPIRNHVSATMTLQEMIQKVKEHLFEAMKYSEVPFDRIVEELKPERDLSYHPLFQVVFNYENTYPEKVSLTDLEVEVTEETNGTSKFDLSLNIRETSQGLQMKWEYSKDLFYPETIKRMNEHFFNILQAVVEKLDQPLGRIPLLSVHEKEQLAKWNRTEEGYRKVCIHQWFEEQAKQQPDAEALITEAGCLTYRQLNQRANQLAHELKRKGIGREDRVGICMNRSANLVISLLAVLKVGSAYVPLDPHYPEERLRFILEDAQAKMVLAEEAQKELLPNHLTTLWLDQWIGEQKESENLNRVVTLSDLAYIIYTSGTTGKPKGVAIEHRNVSVLIHWAQKQYKDPELNGVLISTSICFDLSVYEIFVTLALGGRMILAEHVLQLPELVAKEKVTLINTVPSAMFELVRMQAVPPSVHTVNLAGEPLSSQLVQMIYNETSVKRVLNLYGPSEDTTYSTYEEILKERAKETPLIGRPLPNKQIYVLDEEGQQVPIGVVGELYLAGDGVSREYLNRPELTAERFQIREIDGQQVRVYKTGDLVKVATDGRLVFLGRVDHQIKIRGFRVELGEIEERLRSHPDVSECVVVKREDEGHTHLVAYLTQQDGIKNDKLNFKDYLGQYLPLHMVPHFFVLMKNLPLTPNGKVDRNALPKPEKSEEDKSQLETVFEKSLAQIWTDVFKAPCIGRDFSFFDLGGDSLLANRLVLRVKELFNIDFHVRDVFKFPTIRLMAKAIELAKTKSNSGKISSYDRLKPASASIAQNRLWFIQQMDKQSAVYNIPFLLKLKGKLDLPRLHQSINAVVQKHESLRTYFKLVDGEVYQRVDLEHVHLSYTDFTDILDKKTKIKSVLNEDYQRPFYLTEGPLIRFKLIQLSAIECWLAITMHHIISDGWSMGIFVNDLLSYYQNERLNKDTTNTLQYIDYTYWHREWLENNISTGILYWTELLKGAPELLNIQTDFPRPAKLSYRGDVYTSTALPELTDRLKKVSKKEQATLFMTLLGSFQTLLYRYTRQEDFVVGVPFANRNQTETEKMIGFFVNTLPIRNHVSATMTLQEMIQKVKEHLFEAMKYSEVPFDRIVEELKPERDLSYHPLFQVVFNYENTYPEKVSLTDLEVEVTEETNGTSKFDLSLNIRETSQGLQMKWEYSKDLFYPETIKRMNEHFFNILQAVVEKLDQPLGRIPLLSVHEKEQLAKWNRTEEGYRKVCIHQWFEEQAKQQPDAEALITEAGCLTYRQLNQRANQLAHELKRKGIGREDRVGICMNRSANLVISLLAVLKVGSAYVPLDPHYPEERLRFILEDAQAKMVLAEEAQKELLPNHLTTLWLDQWIGEQKESENLNRVVTLSDLAYIIYTSGTTGKPKGVAIPHRAISNHMEWMLRTFELTPKDLVLQKTPFSFDASVWEFYAPLLSGGKLVMASPQGHFDPDYLIEIINEKKITTLQVVPTLLQMLLDHREFKTCKSLRKVFCGGEALSLELQKRFHSTLGSKLINLYGPTEACIDTTYYICNEKEYGNTVPIGRSIDNARTYVLDEYLQLVPSGVPGELYIGGKGLARGYVNQPELTAEKFIRNPFDKENKDLIYKTGDLVRYRVDGEIEFLGRVDNQIKIRGYRIELGEIESVLCKHPDVSECVVVKREEKKAPYLSGYVVFREAFCQTTAQSLRSYLIEELPEYMTPSFIVILDQIPLTPNGKVDRKALPVPKVETENSHMQAARTSVEKVVLSVWNEVLESDNIGIYQNFFELGGHSLLATRLIAKLNHLYQIECSVTIIFQNPTVAKLAKALEDIVDKEALEELSDTVIQLNGLSEEELMALLEQV
ncbi:amino acid adenylation domain-containing protein [Marininema mesophilum]|uniref:Amino acid adenylation domain-containing protein n=1 Tax=Marininema mesophilum TaxID=1048340 RepID=A0A1H2YH37_9BACL|nr:non-ribosomal peptide synthetase [Marininema mesophilum]SDX04486.1 amino acid adenylation domain-containing protein [Marininema mesophilum]